MHKVRQAKDGRKATDCQQRWNRSEGKRQPEEGGRGGHDREECQNAQERQVLPAQSQTQPVWGGETESRGKRLAPSTQGHVKKDPCLSSHPPISIYPSIHPFLCLHITFAP